MSEADPEAFMARELAGVPLNSAASLPVAQATTEELLEELVLRGRSNGSSSLIKYSGEMLVHLHHNESHQLSYRREAM